MKIFQIRYLILFSTFLILLNGCAGSHYQLEIPEDHIITRPMPELFPRGHIPWMYKTGIELKDQYYSGILVIKNLEGNGYRVVFMNELGMKFFDFEINRNYFKVHHCFESFNRKSFLKILEDDFKVFFGLCNIRNGTDLLFSPEEDLTVHLFRDHGKVYYYVSNTTGRLERIEKFSIWGKTLSVDLNDYNIFPDRIRMRHHNRKLNIQFTLLQNYNGEFSAK